jgi:heptaprenyl diphosphate synthase
MPSMMPLSRRLDRVAFLGACCLFLSSVEYLLPKPIPFLRIGIANLPVLLALDILSPPLVLLVVALKVAGQALLAGTLFSYVFLFSLIGSTASGLTMVLLRSLLGRRMSLVGVGVLGAFVSNAAQLILARVLIFGEGAWLIAPPFLALGTVSAAALGVFAERFSAGSQWLRNAREER